MAEEGEFFSSPQLAQTNRREVQQQLYQYQRCWKIDTGDFRTSSLSRYGFLYLMSLWFRYTYHRKRISRTSCRQRLVQVIESSIERKCYNNRWKLNVQSAGAEVVGIVVVFSWVFLEQAAINTLRFSVEKNKARVRGNS
eukprot:TRINITY_DN6519_c0_g1_i6.p2 TRINITY_DN6519_c0_g1~~TRINITY_DN6519_c0_g1_i6.p2  ORF type:complete len:157 (-),score=19.57 TRINITY_DN6519_c0_g1_i6:347-763(-)